VFIQESTEDFPSSNEKKKRYNAQKDFVFHTKQTKNKAICNTQLVIMYCYPSGFQYQYLYV
jgi:hypothetical protein